MGDETKYYTVQVKGKAYRFTPLPPEDIERVVMILNMNVGDAKILKALTRVLAESAGPEQWDELTDRYLAKEIDERELTVNVFKRLLERQNKDAAPAAVDAE